MRHPHVIAGHQYPVADFEALILCRFDHASDIYAAHAGETADDFARSGCGECVLVIDSGVMGAAAHLTPIQIIERQLDEAAARSAVFHQDTKTLPCLPST